MREAGGGERGGRSGSWEETLNAKHNTGKGDPENEKEEDLTLSGAVSAGH